ncbi:hypothetical protein A2U01_0046023, partial [Trifolium medium]|nr:hypothetical protein [Trifolium medium]
GEDAVPDQSPYQMAKQNSKRGGAKGERGRWESHSEEFLEGQSGEKVPETEFHTHSRNPKRGEGPRHKVSTNSS